MKYLRRFALAGAVSLVLFLIIGLTLFGIDFYYDGKNRVWWGKGVFKTPRPGNFSFCEQKNVTNFIREPLNVVSSFFFIPSYVYPFFYGVQDCYKNVNTILSHYPDLSIVIAIVALFHNIGTSLNHISASNFGLIMDNIGAWSLFGGYIILAFKIFLNIPRTTFYMFYMVYILLVILLAGLNHSILLQNIVSAILIIGAMIMIVCFHLKNKTIIKRAKWIWIGVGFGITAIITAAIDPYTCYKHAFSTHSIFHVLGAVGIWSFYLYFWTLKFKESENNSNEESV